MAPTSSARYHFGDLLALARQHWVRQMADELAQAGFDDYRRTDAALVRLLSAGPRSIGELGAALGITRQGARKLVARLERRGFVLTARDRADARRLDATLTDVGLRYAAAVRAAIDALDARLDARVSSVQLLAADRVLRATLPDDATRQRVARIAPPPGAPRRPQPERSDSPTAGR